MNENFDLEKNNQAQLQDFTELDMENVKRLKKVKTLSKTSMILFIVMGSIFVLSLLIMLLMPTLLFIFYIINSFLFFAIWIINIICAICILKGDYNPNKIKLDQKIIWGLLTLSSLIFGFIFSQVFMSVAKKGYNF